MAPPPEPEVEQDLTVALPHMVGTVEGYFGVHLCGLLIQAYLLFWVTVIFVVLLSREVMNFYSSEGMDFYSSEL